MGCNTCKGKIASKAELTNNSIENIQETKFLSKLLGYILRFFLFLIFLTALVPFILPLIIWMLFSTLVLNKKLDVFQIVYAIGKRLYKKEEDEIEDDEE